MLNGINEGRNIRIRDLEVLWNVKGKHGTEIGAESWDMCYIEDELLLLKR